MQRNTLFSSVQLAFSFIGAGIAGIDYYAHKNNIDLPCMTGSGCDLVQASRWSHIFGVPVALIGFLAYSVLSILSVLKLNADPELVSKFRSLMALMSGVGFAYSWYLQYVSHVYIGLICSWCMASAITMTLLFLTVVFDIIGDRPQAKAVTNLG